MKLLYSDKMGLFLDDVHIHLAQGVTQRFGMYEKCVNHMLRPSQWEILD